MRTICVQSLNYYRTIVRRVGWCVSIRIIRTAVRQYLVLKREPFSKTFRSLRFARVRRRLFRIYCILFFWHRQWRDCPFNKNNNNNNKNVNNNDDEERSTFYTHCTNTRTTRTTAIRFTGRCSNGQRTVIFSSFLCFPFLFFFFLFFFWP